MATFGHMKTSTLFLLFISFSGLFGQSQPAYQVNHEYDEYFKQAYEHYPSIPNGVLEAVAWSKTRIQNINADVYNSCIGLPKAHGVMGLTADGKGYLVNNVEIINHWYDHDELLTSPEHNIMGYASAYSNILNGGRHAIGWLDVGTEIMTMHYALSELPHETTSQQFAIDTELFQIISLLIDSGFMSTWGYETMDIDLVDVFGKENYEVLSAQKVLINGTYITNEDGVEYKGGGCLDYPTALWVPADPSNYSSRAGTPISAVTVHDVEGTYAGCISWFQNPSANVSAHYVIRSFDGQITQMVCEADKGWHVGSENPYTIGLEHEGYASTPSWYTLAMYQSSADLVRDICTDNSINPLRTYSGPACLGSSTDCELGGCIKVKGHQHYPGQSHTDPGIYWDWPFYYELINNNPTIDLYTAASGNLYDTGGPTGNYGDDERFYMLIEPLAVTDITLTVNSFDIEYNWDYLYIYDGSSSTYPLIGQFTGTSISSTITSTGGAIILEFRSDCATTDPGWDISWTSTPIVAGINANTEPEFNLFPNPAGNSFHIMTSASGMVQIFNTQGKLVLTQPVNSNETFISIEHLESGSYFVQFSTNLGVGTKRLLKF